ncbi:transmembrane protein 237-like isoform X2 [Glandiceps talaboti]
MAAAVATSSKPRSLPPLTSGSDPEPGLAAKSGKRKKKKKPTSEGVETSDSPATGSTSRHNAAEEREAEDKLPSLSGSSENILSETPRKRKKKMTSAKLRHGYDFESGAEELRGSGQINNLKSSPSARRRRVKESGSSSKRVPRSISDEILQQEQNGSIETPRETPRKKSKPKPKEDSPEGGDEGGETSRTPRSKPPSGRKQKKKKTPRVAMSADDDYQADGEVSVDFMVHDEDLITQDKDRATDAQMPSHTTTLPSQPTGLLFMERKSGFKSAQKSRLARVKETEEEHRVEPITKMTSPELALSVHRGFMTISLFCHGILAGFALWQCVVVYSLSADGDTNFLTNYYRLSLPAMSMYYFLLAVCTISAFDRYDLARPNRKFFKGLLTFQSGAISILVYLITLIFSVSIAALDDRIGLYGITDSPLCEPDCPETSLWDDQDAEYRLYVWRILNLMRVIGAILGWIIISLTPATDYTQDHLKKTDEPLWDETVDHEMNQRQHGV